MICVPPPEVQTAMQEYKDSCTTLALPQVYIDWHVARAKHEFEFLVAEHGLYVVGQLDTAGQSHGYACRMRIIRGTVITPTCRIVNLIYSERAQAYAILHPLGEMRSMNLAGAKELQ